nr:MAG TPA: hypothetical protein [Bacteriophage sp.]
MSLISTTINLCSSTIYYNLTATGFSSKISDSVFH